jgi:hypothetical protein
VRGIFALLLHSSGNHSKGRKKYMTVQISSLETIVHLHLSQLFKLFIEIIENIEIKKSVHLGREILQHPRDCAASAASHLGDNFSLGTLKNDFAAWRISSGVKVLSSSLIFFLF